MRENITEFQVYFKNKSERLTIDFIIAFAR